MHQTSCINTQQNGVAERKHRHLFNVARSLLFQSCCPLEFWSDCILTVIFLINRTPSSVLNGKSPFEIVYGKLPNYSLFKSLGCLCFATKLNVSDKFGSRAEKCVFLGYADTKKAYKLYALDSGSIFFSRDVQFYENVFSFKLNKASSIDVSHDVHRMLIHSL